MLRRFFPCIFKIRSSAPASSPPADPSDLVATQSATVDGRIDLTWTDNSSDETAFSIEQSANGTTGWAEVATPAANATSQAITGLTPGVTYYFRMRSNRSGEFSSYTSVANAASGFLAPSAPSGLAGVQSYLVNGRIDLTWTDNASNETAFAIEQSPAGAGTWVEVATPAANAVSASITGLSNDTSYDFRIRANRSGTYSSYSSTATIKTPAVTVAGLTMIYHLTEDGAGALSYDSVDFARDMADRATDAAFRGLSCGITGTLVDFSMAFDAAAGGAGSLWDAHPFELQFNAGGAWKFKEAGVQKATGTYIAGDVFRLLLIGGVVSAAKNGATAYTSVTAVGSNAAWVKISMHNDPAAQQITTSSDVITQN